MPIVRFDHIADMLAPAIRNALNLVERRNSPAHAKLAYCYVWNVVLPALQTIYQLPNEKAEAQAKEVTPREQ